MLFVFVLLIVFLFNIIKEDNIVSVAEKRKLQLMPDITFSSILDGRFSSEFDNYTIEDGDSCITRLNKEFEDLD